MTNHSYELLDSGQGRKLERFGSYVLARPAAQAVWQQALPEEVWARADAAFSREKENAWVKKSDLPETWTIDIDGIKFKLSTTDFGHLGIFPEQRNCWKWIQSTVKMAKERSGIPPKVLNLFAYSGGSTLAAAKGGASVCHLDASKGMVAWARENATLNNLEQAPIRWIVDDVTKFLLRERKREHFYDAIIFDPPTFGRGSQGEIFKIEEEILNLMSLCRTLLSEHPLFVFFSCHTPGFSPIAMDHLMNQMMEGISGKIDAGEMILSGRKDVFSLPSGTFARWSSHGG
jgi:23S rRNA (cytosine1962-C5)-methyltransferase